MDVDDIIIIIGWTKHLLAVEELRHRGVSSLPKTLVGNLATGKQASSSSSWQLAYNKNKGYNPTYSHHNVIIF